MAEVIIRVHGNDARAQRKLLVRRDTGEVVNVIVVDPDVPWQCPDGCELVDPPEDLPVGPGWKRLPDGSFEAPPEPAPEPDVTGFLVAAYENLGHERAREIMRAYPEIVPAFDRQNWELGRRAIDDALADQFISQQEYDLIQQLLAQYHIPEA